MEKDPAFLFYSKDFYEGTRMLLPEERACYLDLMIYQHQNGCIPNDIKRLLMYCSGVDEATLIATLKAKFKLTEKGWVNEKLEKVISERAEFKNEQSINGTLGQFWKKCKANLTLREYKKLRSDLENTDKREIYNYISDKDFDKATLKGSLQAMLEALLKGSLQASLKHIEDVNVIVDEIKNENKGKGGMGEKPEVIFPFDSTGFRDQWDQWKRYKLDEFRFKYKGAVSEQAALKRLAELSGGNEATAIAIMHQSMSEGWKGFFELKTQTNHGKRKQYQASDNLKTRIASKLAARGAG